MKRLYIVRLIRKDNAPAEEYCCSLLEDAITFLNAFQYDTSGVYDRIFMLFLERWVGFQKFDGVNMNKVSFM